MNRGGVGQHSPLMLIDTREKAFPNQDQDLGQKTPQITRMPLTSFDIKYICYAMSRQKRETY